MRCWLLCLVLEVLSVSTNALDGSPPGSMASHIGVCLQDFATSNQ